MKHKATILSITLALLASVACTNRPKVIVQPLTPEQRFAIYKTGAQVASAGLEVRIAQLEKNHDANAEKIKILTATKGFVDEFNVQVADITVIDLSNRERIKEAIKRGLTAADNLTANDVLQLKDPQAQADIRAAIAIARSALQSFDALFPEAKQ